VAENDAGERRKASIRHRAAKAGAVDQSAAHYELGPHYATLHPVHTEICTNYTLYFYRLSQDIPCKILPIPQILRGRNMSSSRHLTSATQIDRKLPQLREAAHVLAASAPSTGWIKALRSSLGLSVSALGRRLKVTQQSTDELEKSERAGTITLASLRRAAAALDADFVYALVPRKNLRDTIAARARELAKERIAPIAHSMRLEAQGLSDKELAEQVEELARDLERRPRDLWR
jgi:predicted DNA-binding mobile mystery protein A